MIRPCKGDTQPSDPDPAAKALPRYLVYIRSKGDWYIAVWGGRGKGWAIDGVPVNPVCWQPLPAQVRG
jgi:hypothetical protein